MRRGWVKGKPEAAVVSINEFEGAVEPYERSKVGREAEIVVHVTERHVRIGVVPQARFLSSSQSSDTREEKLSSAAMS